MENPRPEKVAVVDEVAKRLSESDSVFVTEYRGLTVDQLAQLRNALRPVGGKYKVYKNTLVRRAAKSADLDLGDHLTGPTALAFTETTPDGQPGDVVTVAKALRDFARDHPDLVVKGGVYEGNPLTPEDINVLADVEPRDVLLAKFAGLLQAPMSQFARLMQAVPQNFAYGLQALVDAGGAVGEPQDEAAPVEAGADAIEETSSEAQTPTPTDETEPNEPKANEMPSDTGEESEETK